MKHIIIGTAGHVDHGKTALIKALTGIETDRLVEEKRRGVTIEPGFAYLDFEDGTRAGIIDVPGHERFIRNMLAGAGGVDLAMLVVAADEGVMPQTREHLGILTQLGINNGLIVITKTDKAEPDWLELVIDDISELVAGTFLEGKSYAQVSAQTGSGLQELKSALRKIIDETAEKDTDVPFRLPVDRVFPVDGFGTVVTGTLIEGSVKTGDTAEIQPSGEKAPVRNIQVHGENSEAAYAGQRTAISLAGVKRGEIKRGDVISAEGLLNVTNVIDVKLNVLPDSQRTIKNNAELHLYHGARTMLVKAFLLDKNEILPGESCYARLKLKEALPCKRGDRFVVRFFSPVETIGGGIILDSLPENRISRNEKTMEALWIREKGDIEEITGLAAYELGGVFPIKDLCKRADIEINTCNKAVDTLLASNIIAKLSREKFISVKVLEKYGKECGELLNEYHKKNPLKTGMNVAELRQKLMPETETQEANAVLSALESRGNVKITNNTVSLPDFMIKYTDEQIKIKEKLISEFTISGYDVKTPEELSGIFSKNEKSVFEQIFESMLTNGDLVMLSKQIYWLKSDYEEAIRCIKDHFEKNDEIALAQCRDILGTSRKYALALLEHLDGRQVTKLQGEARKINKGFN